MEKVKESHKKLIGETREKVIKRLFIGNPNSGLVLTGSSALIIQGAIQREVEDLDFILPSNTSIINYGESSYDLSESKYLKSNSSESNARIVELNGIKCEFYYDSQSPVEFNFDNVLIRVQSMKAIREKKLAYIDFYSEKINFLSQKLIKHIGDIRGIDVESSKLLHHNV